MFPIFLGVKMYNLASDYLEAHPEVMEALNKTNFIQTVGYGVKIKPIKS